MTTRHQPLHPPPLEMVHRTASSQGSTAACWPGAEVFQYRSRCVFVVCCYRCFSPGVQHGCIPQLPPVFVPVPRSCSRWPHGTQVGRLEQPWSTSCLEIWSTESARLSRWRYHQVCDTWCSESRPISFRKTRTKTEKSVPGGGKRDGRSYTHCRKSFQEKSRGKKNS